MPDSTESDTDLIAVRHPHKDNPGVFVVSRGAARVMAESGWVEAKSPEAKAAIAGATPITDNTKEISK